eukprot:2757685-Pleurochrysis_carterae.AAC.1
MQLEIFRSRQIKAAESPVALTPKSTGSLPPSLPTYLCAPTHFKHIRVHCAHVPATCYACHRVHLNLARRVSGAIGVVAVFGLGEAVEGRVKAEEIAVTSSVPSIKVLLYFLDLSLKQLKRWVSARKSRTRAAIVASELEEANAVAAVAWTAGFDSRRANRLIRRATPVLSNVAPAKTIQSWQSRCLEHGNERRFILSHVVAGGCGFIVDNVERRVDVRGINAMAAARELQWILTADHSVAEGVTPQLIKGLDSKVAILI